MSDSPNAGTSPARFPLVQAATHSAKPWHGSARTRSSSATFRAALRTNAWFALVSGLILAIGGPFVAVGWRVGPAWSAVAVGVGVVIFGLLVAWVAVLDQVELVRLGRLVSAADLAWVLATGALLAIRPPTTSGVVALTSLAGVVAVLCGWQLVGLRITDQEDPLRDLETLGLDGVLRLDPGRAWELITDHELYGRLAPNLRRVEVISSPGEPLCRRCTPVAGDPWEETCTLWDEGRTFEVTVNTTRYPYPIAELRGQWTVAPHDQGSLVGSWFVLRAEPTLLGGLFILVFRPLFPLALRRILAGWRRAATERHRAAKPSAGSADTGV